MPSSQRKTRKKMTQVLVPVSGPSAAPSTFLCSEELALPFGSGPSVLGEGPRSSSGGHASGQIGSGAQRRAVTGGGGYTPDGRQKLAPTVAADSRAVNHPTTATAGRGRIDFGGDGSVVTPSEISPPSSRAKFSIPDAFASVGSLFSAETDVGGLSTSMSCDEANDDPGGDIGSIGRCNTAYLHGQNAAIAKATLQDGRTHPALVLVEEEETWKSRFVSLCLYKSQHGHCLVPSSRHSTASETSLAMWVKLCRDEYEVLGTPDATVRMLTQERIDMLDSIDFEWNVKLSFPGGLPPPNATNTRSRHARHMSWNERYSELLQFKAKYGDANVPAVWAANRDLAEWVAEQRRDYRRYTLADCCSSRGITEEKIDRLERIGFQWSETTPGNADAAAGREPRPPPPPPPPPLHQNRNSSMTAHLDPPQAVATVSPSPMKPWHQASGSAASSSKSGRHVTPIAPAPFGDPEPDATHGPYGHGKGENQSSWDDHFEELLKYGEKNGTYNVSKSYKGGDLYDWVQYQKIMYYRGEDEGRGKLGPAQRLRYDKLKESEIFAPRGSRVDSPAERDGDAQFPATTRSWDQSFALLKRHFEEVGDVDIYYIADPDLYQWTNTVMIQYLERDVNMHESVLSETLLSDARYNKLKDLGIGSSWSHNDKLWHIMFHKLSRFELEYGHCEVPGSNATQLGLWIYRQRYSLAAFIAKGMKSTSFTHKRKAKLDGIGFDWKEYDKGYIDPDDIHNTEGASAASAGEDKKKEDDADSIDSAESQTLAERLGLRDGFTGRDIERFNNECPNCHQRFKGLSGLKYHIDNDVCNNEYYTPKEVFPKQQDHNDKLWQENYEALCAYKKKHGDLEGGIGDDPLCKWAKRQRYECREWMNGQHTRFNAERKRKLDRIGFDFKGYDGQPISSPARGGPTGIAEATTADHQWNQNFLSLVEFKDEHGHFEGITPINEVLGRWVYKQRYNLRSLISGKSKGNFSIEKKEVLDSIDFDWQGYDDGWKKWKRTSAPRKVAATASAATLPQSPPRQATSFDVPEGGACPGCKQVFHSKSGWLYHVKNGVCGVHACTRCRAMFSSSKGLRKHEKNVDCQPWTYEQAKIAALNAIMDAPSNPNDADGVVLDDDYKFDKCCECGVLEKPGDQMLLCDRCNLATHLECTHDNLTEIPDGDWFCRNCSSKADKLDYCCECGVMEKPDGPPMLLCDGCDVACHVKCTHDGLSEVPEDEWFCRKCTAKRNIRLGDALTGENYAPPSFEDLLEKLKVFRAENGHCDVPPELEELHRFAEKLRESYLKRRKTSLQLEHEEQLDKIGFNWPESNGSTPTSRPSTPVKEIDAKSKKSVKNSQQIILIGPSKKRGDRRPPEYCGPGVSHGEQQLSWQKHFDELLDYGQKYGTYNVSKSHGDGDLYSWIQYQRYLFYKGERDGRSKGLGPAQRERYDKLKKAEIFIPLTAGEGSKRKRDEVNSNESDSNSGSDSEESSTPPSRKRQRKNSQ